MVVFETYADFENAVKCFIEQNLKIDGKTLGIDWHGQEKQVLTDVCLTCDRSGDYFSEVMK